jgi:anti-anti-sigma factor
LPADTLVEIAITQGEGYSLATISGPLDDSAPDAFRETLHPLFNDRGVRLVVDLSGSPRVSSVGLTAMVRLVTDANTRAGRVIFAAPVPFVSEVFRVTKLEKFFDVAPTRANAIEQLA